MKYYLQVLKKYAVFSGRAPRKEFWMFFLFNLLFSIGLRIIDYMLGTTYIYYSGSIPVTQGYISGFYNLAVFIPYLAVSVRRMHDINKSGWMLLIPWLPLLLSFFAGLFGNSGLMLLLIFFFLGLFIWLIVLCCTVGTTGPNKYGEDPYGGGFKFSFEEEGNTPTEE